MTNLSLADAEQFALALGFFHFAVILPAALCVSRPTWFFSTSLSSPSAVWLRVGVLPGSYAVVVFAGWVALFGLVALRCPLEGNRLPLHFRSAFDCCCLLAVGVRFRFCAVAAQVLPPGRLRALSCVDRRRRSGVLAVARRPTRRRGRDCCPLLVGNSVTCAP